MNQSANTNAGGWTATGLRASLNGGPIWEQAPVRLRGASPGQGALVPVRKMYRTGGNQSNTTITGSTEAFFLLCYAEMFTTPQSSLSSYWSTLTREGTLYAWWASKKVSAANSTAYAPVIKTLGSSGSAINYWTRSAHPGGSTNFIHIFRMHTTSDVANRANSA